MKHTFCNKKNEKSPGEIASILRKVKFALSVKRRGLRRDVFAGSGTFSSAKTKKTAFRLSYRFGGDGEDRTLDLMNAIHALSQLSYAPKCVMYISRQ